MAKPGDEEGHGEGLNGDRLTSCPSRCDKSKRRPGTVGRQCTWPPSASEAACCKLVGTLKDATLA